MSHRCVPSWCRSDNEVAELTWENGQLAMHGLCRPRVPSKPLSPSWTEKPRAGGTLESIVDQASSRNKPQPPPQLQHASSDLLPWFKHHNGGSAAAGPAMDALVPCSIRREEPPGSTADSAPFPLWEGGERRSRSGMETRVAEREWSCASQSVSENARHMTVDTCETEQGPGCNSASLGCSPETTVSGNPCMKNAAAGADDHDSDGHVRPQRQASDKGEEKTGRRKSSVSTRRSRAAAIHNQSERKRRDKINQRMKALQKLVPNSNKTDKASMLDEVIEYLKQLQAQVQLLCRVNYMPSIMMPMAMQGQLQMPLMAPMGMGMGMGMGLGVVDMNALARPSIPGIHPFLHPAATFVPQISHDGSSSDRFLHTLTPDPSSSFFPSPSQPMTLDAYSRMAAMYQQLHQPTPASGSNNKN